MASTSTLQHSSEGLRGGTLDAASLALVATHLTGVREKCTGQALASSPPEAGGDRALAQQQLPHEQRLRPHGVRGRNGCEAPKAKNMVAAA